MINCWNNLDIYIYIYKYRVDIIIIIETEKQTFFVFFVTFISLGLFIFCNLQHISLAVSAVTVCRIVAHFHCRICIFFCFYNVLVAVHYLQPFQPPYLPNTMEVNEPNDQVCIVFEINLNPVLVSFTFTVSNEANNLKQHKKPVHDWIQEDSKKQKFDVISVQTQKSVTAGKSQLLQTPQRLAVTLHHCGFMGVGRTGYF